MQTARTFYRAFRGRFLRLRDQVFFPIDKVNPYWSRKRFYSKFLKSGDTVFDVGANHGNRTEVFLGLGCRVIAYEPQPNCAKILRQEFGSNPDFTLVEKAVGSKCGTLELLCSPVDTLSTCSEMQVLRAKASGRFNACRNWDAFVPVPVSVTTLDDELLKFGEPAFVKIDVEGYEPEVLKGLNKSVSAISFEFSCDSLDKAGECLERLNTLGFREFNFCFGESMLFVLPDWLGEQEFSLVLAKFASSYPASGGDIYARSYSR